MLAWYWTLPPAQHNDVYWICRRISDTTRGVPGVLLGIWLHGSAARHRMPVLRKLERGQGAQAELAIRCWHQNSCFQRLSLIKIASFESYRAARTLEHVLISQWQPRRKLRQRLFHSVQPVECALQKRQEHSGVW